ncbi:hypothetical protein BCT90_01595 [Vibrio lentus]|uniref:hypothetical protein n=1 Tax=Vibrio TaxID=662 RepID=UPI00031F3F5A|nr:MULTISPECIES: hypothetical protein [Vibrio]OCH52660.1 hypothetical protein A6E08_21995 [Vibrio lentus]PMI55153.1 hypothetical protein BCU43_16430 [Vibrio lentus]PMK84206.1 hypothetical protein BCT90_01595 [Vibrio lentus]
MKNSGLIFGVVLSVGLVGCGGGGGGGGNSEAPSAAKFSGNGIYVNQLTSQAMLIDSARAKDNLVLGDFNEDAVYIAHNGTTTTNKMKTVGLTVVTSTIAYTDEEQEMTATFSGKSVTLNAVLDDGNFIYSMDKTSDSLELGKIVGTHTNPQDGSTWTINSDGSFIINSNCTISGNLVRNGSYFDIKGAQAVSCAEAKMNGSYDGVLLTVKLNGINRIAGILGDESYTLWGNSPI